MDKQSQPFSFDAIKRAAEKLGILAKKTVEKAVPYLDPTNPFYDTIPVLREARMLSNDLLPYDPASDPAIPFKERILMYLQKYGEFDAVKNTAVNSVKDLGNTFTAPLRDIPAYIKMQNDPEYKKIQSSNLPIERKVKLNNKIGERYGGSTSEQLASANRGGELGMSFTIGDEYTKTAMPFMKPAFNQIKYGVTQFADDIGKTVQVQPAGFQAGFIKNPLAQNKSMAIQNAVTKNVDDAERLLIEKIKTQGLDTLTPDEKTKLLNMPSEKLEELASGFKPGTRVKLDEKIMKGQLKYDDVYKKGGMAVDDAVTKTDDVQAGLYDTKKFSSPEDITAFKKNILTEANLKRNLDDLAKDGITPDENGLITLYRGHSGKGDDSFRAFSYFSTNKKLAQRFGRNVETVKVNPKDLVITNRMGDGITFQNPVNLVKGSHGVHVIDPNDIPNVANQSFYDMTTKPIKIYRAEDSKTGVSAVANGKYFAGSEDLARQYGDVIATTEIPKGSRILNFDAVKNKPNQTVIPQEIIRDPDKLAKWATDNGYDYIKNTNTKGVEYVQLSNKIGGWEFDSGGAIPGEPLAWNDKYGVLDQLDEAGEATGKFELRDTNGNLRGVFDNVQDAVDSTQPRVAQESLPNQSFYDTKFYRGEGGVNQFQNKTSFISGKNFATDPERAKTFGNVTEYTLNPKAKVLKIDTVGKELDQLAKELGVNESDMIFPNALNRELKKKGYDAVIYKTRLGKNGKLDPNGKIVEDVIALNDDAFRVAQESIGDSILKVLNKK